MSAFKNRIHPKARWKYISWPSISTCYILFQYNELVSKHWPTVIVFAPNGKCYSSNFCFYSVNHKWRRVRSCTTKRQHVCDELHISHSHMHLTPHSHPQPTALSQKKCIMTECSIKIGLIQLDDWGHSNLSCSGLIPIVILEFLLSISSPSIFIFPSSPRTQITILGS